MTEIGKIYHLNCGSLSPYVPKIHSLVYCLLVETNDGLLLVDTGFGTLDCTRPSRLMRVFKALLRVPGLASETALHQVEALGFSPQSVRHIVMTHLHIDHSGGLPDFAHARVHVHRREHEAALHPRGILGPFYMQYHWSHGPQWMVHVDDGAEDWFGLPALEVQKGLAPRVLLIPLHGHSPGHCGVAIQQGEGWLLHCGDATWPFFRSGHPDQPYGDPPEWLVRWLLGAHTPKLRALHAAHGDRVEMICSHDPVSFSIHTGRTFAPARPG